MSSAPRSTCVRGAGHHPDEHDAAPQSGDREVGDDVVAAHQLEDHVDGADRVGDVGRQRRGIELAGGEHGVVEPEGARLLQLLGGAGGADDRAPGRLTELQCGGAHAGADRVDEQHLTRLHARPA